MKQLVIDESTARKFYPKADSDFKAELVGAFGEAFFSQKPMDRVKSVEDACEVLGIDPDDVWQEYDKPDEIAYKQLKVITRALNFLANGNKEWVPDYNNSNQRKWYAWWWLNDPGFRLNDVNCDYTNTAVGARLVFISEELARYAATQFFGIYKDYLTPMSNTSIDSVVGITIEQIKSFEDACKVKGWDSEKVLPDVSFYPETHRKALIATAKLFIVIDALNYVDNSCKDWGPDWDDSDQEKYYPWVDMEEDENNPSGFRLNVVGYVNANSGVGARLVYRTRKLAEYGFTQFEALYKDLMVLK